MGKAAQSKTAIVQCVCLREAKGKEGRDINHLQSLEGILEAGTTILNSKGDQILPEKSVGTKRLHFCVGKRLGRTVIITERLVYPRK